MAHPPSLSALPTFLLHFAQEFSRAGYQCFLVGGAVRNLVLGIEPGDFDLCTDATPEQVMRLFKRTIPTGIEHGTVTVLYRRHQFEVTTFRLESEYSDGRRPDRVRYSSDIHEDLSRRDFTVNAMAVNLQSGEFVDPYNGTKDISAKVIRTVGNPDERFSEDGLRLLRAVRFSAVLEFRIEEATRTAIDLHCSRLTAVAMERVREEFCKLMSARDPADALRLLSDSGLLAIFMPELNDCREQSGGGDFDLFGHLVATSCLLPRKNLELRLAGLLHDIGKTACRGRGEDGFIHYHGHEEVGARMASDILNRLKFPKKSVHHVCHLIEHHMFGYEPGKTSDAGVRRLIARVGRDYFDELITLRSADAMGKSARKMSPPRSIGELERHAERVLAADHALKIGDLRIGGNELSEEGIPKGPEMGLVLHALLETVIDDPSQNDEQTLRRIGRNYYHERIVPNQKPR